MPSADIERRVADYYTGKLREHGPTHSGVDWNSAESQLLRFEQFMRMIPRDEPVSVVDYGCGYGAFAGYLEAAGADLAYTGYDVSREMIDSARELAAGRAGWSFTTAREDLSPADFTSQAASSTCAWAPTPSAGASTPSRRSPTWLR